jgi:PAS domain S-box-containing protein
MFGYDTDADLAGRSLLEQIAPAERARVAERVRLRSAGDNSINHYVTRGLRKNGEEFALEVHASSYDEDGAFVTVGVLRDISDRLQLEEQLRESQKMDALGRMAGGVAHDFNNLLMVTMGCADLILTDPAGSERTQRNARLIQSTGERAVALTRQLLALSRTQVVDPKLIDLRQLVNDTSMLLRRVIGPDIELEVQDAPTLARVRVDPGQLQQVLLNLCVNARDAMPRGGRICIGTRNLTLVAGDARLGANLRPGHYVVLSVRDGGHGIDDSVRERLFEPFFTTKVAAAGAGLGLPAVYGIVKQSGGHIAVESRPGAGSVFSVYLPAADSAPPQPRREPVLARRGDSGTVLLVDDELAVRELVQKFLESIGYRVLPAEGGAAALRTLEAGARVDIVVSDLLMPGMSGAELARELDRAAPGLPILFMSGYAHDEDARAIGSRPNSCFLPKPFSLADLTGKLRGLIRGTAAAQT